MIIRKPKKTRITLDVSPQFNERLERLQEIVDADSKASLIRQALQLYEYLAHRTVEGCTFKMIKDGTETEIPFLGPAPGRVGITPGDSGREEAGPVPFAVAR